MGEGVIVNVAVGGTSVNVGRKRRVGVMVSVEVGLGVKVPVFDVAEVAMGLEIVGRGVLVLGPGARVVAGAVKRVGVSVDVAVAVAVGRAPNPPAPRPHQTRPNSNTTTGIDTQAQRRRSSNAISGRVGERISVVAPPGEGGVGMSGLTGREMRGPMIGLEMGGNASACKAVKARAIIPAVA